jgi:hypothetical protein
MLTVPHVQYVTSKLNTNHRTISHDLIHNLAGRPETEKTHGLKRVGHAPDQMKDANGVRDPSSRRDRKSYSCRREGHCC